MEARAHGVHIWHFNQVVSDDYSRYGLLLSVVTFVIGEPATHPILASDEIEGVVIRHSIQSGQQTGARLDNLTPELLLHSLLLLLQLVILRIFRVIAAFRDRARQLDQSSVLYLRDWLEISVVHQDARTLSREFYTALIEHFDEGQSV